MSTAWDLEEERRWRLGTFRQHTEVWPEPWQDEVAGRVLDAHPELVKRWLDPQKYSAPSVVTVRRAS